MLSHDSFRILVSASEEGSKPELGFLISEKGRFFEVVITHRAAPWEVDSQGGKFGVFPDVTLPHLM